MKSLLIEAKKFRRSMYHPEKNKKNTFIHNFVFQALEIIKKTAQAVKAKLTLY